MRSVCSRGSDVRQFKLIKAAEKNWLQLRDEISCQRSSKASNSSAAIRSCPSSKMKPKPPPEVAHHQHLRIALPAMVQPCRASLKDKISQAAEGAVLNRRPHRRPKLCQQDQPPIRSLNPIDSARRLKASIFTSSAARMCYSCNLLPVCNHSGE